jgi:hypothetical protein
MTYPKEGLEEMSHGFTHNKCRDSDGEIKTSNAPVLTVRIAGLLMV